MIELRLLGGLDISGTDLSPDIRSRRRHPLALLALVAASPQAIGRDRIMAFLWPESDAQRASNSMRQTLFWLRNDLGEDLFLPERSSGLQLNPSSLAVDMWSFRDAIQRDAPLEAIEAYRGPFMDGFQIPGAPEFSQWVDSERSRLARQHVDVLDALAQQADGEERYDDAVAWRRRQAAADPFSSRAALALLRALAGAGDRSGALEYAANYDNLVRLHLEIEPDAAVTELVAELRTAPAIVPRRRTDLRVAATPAPQEPVAGPPALAASDGRRTTGRSRGRRRLLAAAVVLIALGAFAGGSLVAGRNPTDDPVIILASGINTDAGRDTATRLISCDGPSCPTGDLPQAAFLVQRHQMYANPAPGTGFIAHVKDGTTRRAPGFECCTKATYESSFTLPANALSATISISLLADNQASVAINGVEFGGHRNRFSGENYAGPAATFTSTFPPDPSGTNQLRITFWGGGGAEALNYRAIITYEAGNDANSEELTPR